MEPDWDLHAVVRGFAAINKSAASMETASAAELGQSGSSGAVSSYNTVVKQTEEQKHHGLCSTNLAVAEEVHELCTPPYLLDPRKSQSVQPTISSYMAALQAYKKRTQQQHKGNYHLYGTTPASSAATSTQTPHKPKRRKSQLKKICHVPAEALSSDVWSWRKYGQKPIKGSPYPRSYYKCSSSKACLARKQVERNRSDSTMFIVTYTAEHNHPAPTHKNSLAGTTRSTNPLSSPSATAHDDSNLPTSKPSSSSSMATMSPGGSQDDEVLQQSKDVDSMAVDKGGDINRSNLVDDVIEFLDMDVTDDFFKDLEESSGPPMGCFFTDQFLPNFPWMANNGSSTSDIN